MDPKIDMSNLARMMLEWEMLQRRAVALQATIEATVMQIGKTQTVGNVRASYSGGRKSYNYSEGAMLCPMVNQSVIKEFTITPEPRTDWRKVCEHAGVERDDIPFTQSEPSVTVKLLAE